MDEKQRLDLRGILQSHYLFSDLMPEHRQHLAESADLIQLAADETLFRQGDPSRHFYYLAEGQIKLFGISPGGDEKVVEIITPGQTFGEAVMFFGRPDYPVYAQAINESHVFRLSSDLFVGMLKADPSTCLKIMGHLSRRLHGRLQDVLTLTQKNATHRVVRYLLKQLPEGTENKGHIVLQVPKQVIASRLALQPETLSRVMTALAKAGLISVEGRLIRVHDRNRLQEFE